MNVQPLEKLRTRLQNCSERFDTLDAWMDVRDAQSACREAGLENFLLAAEDKYYPEGRLADVFRKSFYTAWLAEVMASVPSVESFQVHAQERRVSDFRKLEADCLRENQRRIQRELIARIPISSPNQPREENSAFRILSPNPDARPDIDNIPPGTILCEHRRAEERLSG